MAQQQWTVPGFGGVPYNVGLYHGEKTGHLLVQCSGKVLIIDFGVTKTKDYSFMLGEEVYELKIIKENDGYSYHFSHNEDIQTPHNIRREKTVKTDKRRLWAVGILFVVAIISIFAIRSYWSNAETRVRNQLAAGEGEYTQARIIKESHQWLIIYKVNNKLIKQQLLDEDSISALGYHLATGDGYQTRILPKNKYIYYIDWTQPDEHTANRLLSVTIERHQSLHLDLALRAIRCQLQLAYDMEGIEGLSKFYQQEVDDWPKYNKNAYFRLIRGDEYQRRVESCILGLEG